MDEHVETFLLRLGTPEELEDLTRAFYQCKLVAQMKEEEEEEEEKKSEKATSFLSNQ